MTSSAPPPLVGAPSPGLSFPAFVALVACLMAVNALAIDSMLPALPEIGRAVGIADENQRQWIIASYMLGFGAAQLVYGPLSDRFGRKPVLLPGLVIYAITSIAVGFADSFATIIAARALQGVAAAATRVLAVSIVRDCYGGRQMARVMSLSFIVFLAVPILAPSLGQLVMLVAPWNAIFFALAGFGLLMAGIVAWRLAETLHPNFRQPLSPARILLAARLVATNRFSFGYTLASALLFGALMGFINSSQQIFGDTFGQARLFTIIFAGVAASMAAASFLNSRLVERIGTRRMSHTALLVFIATAAVHLALVTAGVETIWSFSLLQGFTMASFALAAPNFNAMAMEPMGAIAGTASSIQGFFSTVLGALVGVGIGQSFDGTTFPLVAGYLAVGVAALVIVAITERGRLFAPQLAPA